MLIRRNRPYISKIDEMLTKFDASHPPSATQQAEIEKYKRIYKLRDKITPLPETKDIWEDF